MRAPTLWNQIGLFGSIACGVIPVIWPTAQAATYIFAAAIAGIVVSVGWWFFSNFRLRSPFIAIGASGNKASDWDERQESVYGKAFLNETVEIDRKIFNKCSFTNATLNYRGTGQTSFIECNFHGSTILQTSHPAAKAFAALAGRFSALPIVKEFRLGERNPEGKITFFTPPGARALIDAPKQSDVPEKK